MLNILVTGGGTVAPIDDIRAITNTSTGRFSSAISEAALRREARVWHIHTPNALVPLPAQVSVDLDSFEEIDHLRHIKAQRKALIDRLTLLPLAEGTVPEYLASLRKLLISQSRSFPSRGDSRLGHPHPAFGHPLPEGEGLPQSPLPPGEGRVRVLRLQKETALDTQSFDAIFLAMAVSDYAPEPIIGKLKSDLDELVIHCKRVPKVIQSVRDWAPDTYLVGFKLTSGASEAELIARATEANEVNRTDLTIANDLQLYRQGKHTVHLVRPGQPVVRLGGMDIAGRLVDRVFRWIGERPR